MIQLNDDLIGEGKEGIGARVKRYEHRRLRGGMRRGKGAKGGLQRLER